MQKAIKRLIALSVSFCVLVTTSPGAVDAAMIGTQTALSIEQRVERIDDITRWLMRDDVTGQLKSLGVSAEAAKKRVASMTDAELIQVQQRIDDLPVGVALLLYRTGRARGDTGPTTFALGHDHFRFPIR